MGIISRMRKQEAWYWEVTDPASNDFGETDHTTPPVTVSCRWEDIQEEFIDVNDSTRVSRAVVYVDRVLTINGILKLKESASETAPTGDPRDIAGAYAVRQFNQLPNLKNTETLLTAYL